MQSRSSELAPAVVQDGIEAKVVARLSGRLRDFSVSEEGGSLVLHGKASSYHVKQLAQDAVMDLTDRRIGSNRIEVLTH